MNRRLSKYCILWLHQSWMKFVQKWDIIQCSTNKSSVPESTWHPNQKSLSKVPQITNLKNDHLFLYFEFLHSITNNGLRRGVVYCSTMCQYNKWSYPHRDSIIMPCIDQWTLTGSRSCGCQDLPFSWVSFSLITSSLISFRLAVTFSSVNQPVRGFRGMVKSWMGSWKTKVTDYQLGRWSHKA